MAHSERVTGPVNAQAVSFEAAFFIHIGEVSGGERFFAPAFFVAI